MNRFSCLCLVLLLVALLGCRTTPGEENDAGIDAGGDAQVEFPDAVAKELTGNERWVQPTGTARITFFVDDRANQTFEDGDMTWTGSWAWDDTDNTIVFSAAWGPTDGPYPLLYDDGPVRDGGHEMEGAEAGDHIFSTEVYYKAEEAAEFSYGVLNELGFWMWEGTNGFVEVPAGSTETYVVQGLSLKAFGDIDLKLTVDIGKVNPAFSFVEEWDEVNVYVKGSTNMWTPLQILDAGPDINKGDDVAGDGIYTFVQGKNLGKHTGLLFDGQHAQFTFVFGKPEEDVATASEYKILTEGVQKGATEGIKAWLSCDGGDNWTETGIVWEEDSWGSTENTTVVAKCDGTPPPPDCTTDAECGEGEKCIGEECILWCDLDEECGNGERCVDNECLVWCDVDEECGDGFECVLNQCQEVVVESDPKIASLEPDVGPTDGGTLVVIKGSDFQDGAAVTFEGIAAGDVVVLSSTEMECTAPTHGAGKVDVTVTNPDGGTDTFINGFSYIEEAAAPTIDGLDPVEGPVTGGTAVTISGANFLPGPTVLFGGDIAKSVEFVNSGLVIATTPAGELGEVSVTLVNSDTQQVALDSAYTFVPNVPDYAMLLEPTSAVSYAGQPGVSVFAEVYEPLVTDSEGHGAALQAEYGYGAPEIEVEDWAWEAADYDGDSGNNDVYTGSLGGDESGLFAYGFRFSMDGTNWLYADSTGNLDGFDVADAGIWESLDLGDGPAIFALSPVGLSVLGGDTVTISGTNFESDLTLTVGGAVVDPVNVTADSIIFTTLPHAPGPVTVKVENPDGESVELDAALRYVLKMTPTVNGNLDDWSAEFLVGENDVVSNWDPEVNWLSSLYVSYDSEYLYVGLSGSSELANCIIGYLDVDYGVGSGIADMAALSDNGGNGDLDDGISNVMAVLDEGFGAEFAFGSKGMTSFTSGSDLGGANDAGWRELAPADEFPWIDGTVLADESNGVVEVSIPLATIFPGGLPVSGKSVGLVIKLTNSYGGFDGLSNQTLPGFFDEDAPETVGNIVVFHVVP
jgi:hypothetical protein